jgi:hypothetical protein
VRLLLVAFGHLGLGRHHKDDQKDMRQPWNFILGVVSAGLRLSELPRAVDSRPAMPDHSRSICQGLSYIGDKREDTLRLFLILAAHGGVFDAGAASMNKLFRACFWARKRVGVSLPASVNWPRLQATCADSGEPHTPNHQSAMQEALVEMQGSNKHIEFVSPCEYRIPGVGICVDVFVRVRRGREIVEFVFEFDGDGHKVGPHGSLNGATMWRNGLLRKLGFKVITVTEAEWASTDDRQQLLMAKLAKCL